MKPLITLMGALTGVALATCPSTPSELPTPARCWVTIVPLDLGVGPLGYCVAVQPGVPDGVWWWSPGRTGCATRSIGPNLMHPHGASVVTHAYYGRTEVQFRLGQISARQTGLPEFVEIHLVLAGGYLWKPNSGARVAVAPRQELDIPEGEL